MSVEKRSDREEYLIESPPMRRRMKYDFNYEGGLLKSIKVTDKVSKKSKVINFEYDNEGNITCIEEV